MQHILTDKTDDAEKTVKSKVSLKAGSLSSKSEDDLLLALSVARISFLDFNQKRNLLKNLDSPHNLALQLIEEILQFAGCGERKSRAEWNGQENLRMAKAEAYQCQRLGIKILFYDDDEYPELLRQIADPPFALFVRGNASLLGGRCLSIVGTRRLSQTGREAARSFAKEASLDGCNIVSGLAGGADAYAHLGALDAFYEESAKADETGETGRTIAVLPSAIDNVVPYTNKSLAAKILQSGGCLVSEYAPGMPTNKWQFVARNRIVAGLSEATVVIEAPAGSGALITADFALEDGRDLFFHEAAFGQAASKISEAVRADLEKSFAAGRVSKYKMENTPEKFLSSGAPVIKDYKDFCVALTEMPGQRSMPPLQGELFT